MERQRIIIPAPSGLRTSIAPTLIGDTEASIAENVEYISGKVRKAPGNYLPISNSTSITACSDSHEPRAIYNFIKTDGTEVPIIYERGLTGALSKKIYYADTSTIPWTWAALQYSSADLALNSSTTPRFLTMRGKLFFSNGDSTEGLMYWTGSGEVVYVRTGGTTSACGRFLIQYKERMGIANGKYYNSTWSSRLSSAIFWSSITDSSGTPIDPYDPDAWHEVHETYNEIEPHDGSEIVAVWVDMGSVFVAKETGIWRMYGEPKDFTIEKISNIGIETDHSLQKHKGMWLFCNKDGFHVFDGRSQPQRIDEPIRNLVMQIPKFDVGGEADTLNYTIDDDWDSPMDGDWNSATGDTTHINPLAGNTGIEIDKISTHKEIEYMSTSTTEDNVVINAHLPTYYECGRAFKFVMDKDPPTSGSCAKRSCMLDGIYIRLMRILETGYGTGNITIALYDDGVGHQLGTQLSSDYTIAIEDLTYGTGGVDEYFDMSDDELVLEEDKEYWIKIIPDDTITFNSVAVRMRTVTAYANYWSASRQTWPVEKWVYSTTLVGKLQVWGKVYESQGVYNTTDNYGDLGGVPTEWGQFHAEDTGETGNIEYKIRTSASGTGDWTDWEIIKDGDMPTITVHRYVDYRVTLDYISTVETPQVTVISVFAYIGTDEVTDRLACSTIFEDNYNYATNKNLDGTYRTFILDNENKWGIRPDQLIRGFMDYKKEKYILTLDINTTTGVKTAELCKMYRGKKIEEFLYDYSARIPTYRATGTKRDYYSQILRTKKYDCGFPDTVKLFKELQFSVGSIFAEGYLQGTFKYRVDDEDWVTEYFPDVTFQGDSAVIRLIFAAETRGEYIQFEWRTYLSGSTYGHPFNIKDTEVDFFIQKLKPVLTTTTGIPSEETHMVEE